MSVLPALANGFLLGLGTGPVCMITCVPVMLPFTLTPERTVSRLRLWGFLGKFLTGRFIAYAAVGLAAGLASAHLGAGQRRLVTVAWVLLSLLLIAYGLGLRLGDARLCRMAGRLVRNRWFPFALGILAGFSVCPPFLLAIAYAVESGQNALTGLAFFMSFFVATSLYVLPLGLLGYMPKKPLWDRVGRLAAVGAGVVFLVQGVVSLSGVQVGW